MTYHKNLSEELGYQNFIESSASVNSSGIVIMWTEDNISINSLSISSQAIHATVKVCSSFFVWVLSIVYASTAFNSKELLWDELMSIATT